MRYQLGDIDFEEGYTEDFQTNSTIKLFWLLFESIIWLRDISKLLFCTNLISAKRSMFEK